MKKVEDLNHAELIELKKNIKKKINNYSLEKYLNGIENAIHKALDKKSFSIISSLTALFLIKFSLYKE